MVERNATSRKLKELSKLCRRDKQLIALAFIPVVWYIIFHYIPMYGILIAFKDYSPVRGITGSEWVGFDNFIRFFRSFYFVRIIRNTLVISIFQMLFSFPVPILFALMINEVKFRRYKRLVQTVTYLPHFVSTVVVVSILFVLFNVNTGVLNWTRYVGGVTKAVLDDPSYFRLFYVGSGIWQSFGFSSILYSAAISGIDSQLYEAAEIDGASRMKRVWHITLPSILPVVTIRLLLALGNLFTQGAEKILLMYSSNTYSVADVISTYVYRVGLVGVDYSLGTAVSLFNTVINFIMLYIFNSIARKIGETSLW